MTRPIRKGHTIDVALQCLKADKHTNPIMVAEMEKIVAEFKGRDRVFDAHSDAKRIERQRTLWAMVPDTSALDRLKDAIVNRAWDLLDGGQAEACDALLEFIPSKDADKMLDEYFRDELAAS